MSIHFSRDNKIRETSGILAGVGGKVREVKEVYAGRNGKPELVWKKGLGLGFICGASEAIYHSLDGVSWESVPTPVSPYTNTYTTFAYGKGKLLCVASPSNSGDSIYYTTDGKTWTRCTFPTGTNNLFIYRIIFNGRMFVAVGDYAWYSYDGVNWLKGNDFAKMMFHDLNTGCLCYGNGRFVCGGQTDKWNPIAQYSDDGVNWKQIDFFSNNYSSYFFPIASVTYVEDSPFLNNGFYSSGLVSTTNNVFYSPDGKTWQKLSLYHGLGDSHIYDLSHHDGYVLGCGSSGKVWYSDNYVNVESTVYYKFIETKADPSSNNLYSIAYGKDRWVCAGESGKSYYSRDNGKTWTAMTGIPDNAKLYGVEYVG